MALDLGMLGQKLRKYREQFQLGITEVSNATGISAPRVTALEAGQAEPSGDEILILADLYKCDFKFFISNEKVAPFEQTETLFRRMGTRLTKDDRWAIQEFLYLCACEEDLWNWSYTPRTHFAFEKTGSYFKGHGESAARALREGLGYGGTQVAGDIYSDLRRIGLHVFRRRLENSDISGLFVRHPTAGRCVLVNYSEDTYRQRFTAAHEAAHAILDADQDFVVDQTNHEIVGAREWTHAELVETRANTFASHYLLPVEVLKAIPESDRWDSDKATDWANKLKVSTEALSYALGSANLIDNETLDTVRKARVPRDAKEDPELGAGLSPRERERKLELLERGLSSFYVNLAFDAYEQRSISTGRLGEMLLVGEAELQRLAVLYGRVLVTDD